MSAVHKAVDRSAAPELLGGAEAIVARLRLERPDLTEASARDILVATADRVQGRAFSSTRFGVVNTARALELARRRDGGARAAAGCPPFLSRNRLVFTYHDPSAANVELHGDFRGWRTIVASFERQSDGLWRASIETPLPGRYRYKFRVDGARWTDDPSHGLKEPDGFGGFNSVVHVGWDVR